MEFDNTTFRQLLWDKQKQKIISKNIQNMYDTNLNI